MEQGRRPAERDSARQRRMAERDEQARRGAPIDDRRAQAREAEMRAPSRDPNSAGVWSNGRNGYNGFPGANAYNGYGSAYSANGPNGADERAINPPWEQESGRLPIPPGSGGGAAPPTWDWDDDLSQSLPGIALPEGSFGDLTGTGKVPAIVPLAPGESWSKGIRAPSPGASVSGRTDMEVDDQPSAQMRALSAGNLARATAIVTAALLLSRILGLLRTSFFAYVFGITYQSDAFTNAFVVPDTIFNIVAGGALASAFIPIFADYLIEKRDRKTAWHIASSALNITLLLLILLAALGIVFADPLIHLTQPTLFACNAQSPCEGPLVIDLTRIMLLQPIFLGGATVAVSILQARQRFALPAIGQVIYTASLIGGIAATYLDNQYKIFGGHLGIYGPTWGVVAGAALQFFVQIPGLAQAKMPYRLSFDFLHPGVREMFRLMAPRLLNAAFIYLSVFINRNLLNLVDPTGTGGAVYGYVTAFTLVLLPVGVFGMAVSQAAFPTLAALVSVGEWGRLRETIMRTVRGVTYLAVPSSLGLIVLADPISRLLLAHGSFDPKKLPLVSGPLIFFSVGLLGLSLVEVLTRSFYALHDTRTAVEVSILQFMFVIGLSIVLLGPMGSDGLALATGLGSLGEALVLLLLLSPRIGGINLKSYGIFFLNVLAASVVMALAALFVYTLALVILPIQPTSKLETLEMIIRVVASISAACVVYFGFSRFLGIDDVVPLERIAKRLLPFLR